MRVEYDQIGSTQTEAIRLSRLGSGPGTVVVARSQSTGMGRMDRRWVSPPGGLYLSVVVEFPDGARGLPPLAVAAWLRRSLAWRWGAHVRIKWPNDLVADDPVGTPRKLSGILVDRPEVSGRRPLGVVGVGVNVLRPADPLPRELVGRMAFLEEFAKPAPTLLEVEDVVLGAVAEAVRAVGAPEGRMDVVAECRRHLFGVGRSVSVDGEDVGVLRTLEDDGAVTVERDGTVARYYAGDLALGVSA